MSEEPETAVAPEALRRIEDEATANIVGLAAELDDQPEINVPYPRVVFRMANKDVEVSQALLATVQRYTSVRTETNPYESTFVLPFESAVQVERVRSAVEFAVGPVASIQVQLAPEPVPHSIPVDRMVQYATALRVKLLARDDAEFRAELREFLAATGHPELDHYCPSATEVAPPKCPGS